MSSSRPSRAPTQCLTHLCDVFRRPCSACGAWWFLIHNVPACSETFNPPEDRVASGNGPVLINIEFSTKEPLHCCDRLTTSNKAIVSEHDVVTSTAPLWLDWHSIRGGKTSNSSPSHNHLPCTICSKNVRLPCVTLYIYTALECNYTSVYVYSLTWPPWWWLSSKPKNVGYMIT